MKRKKHSKNLNRGLIKRMSSRRLFVIDIENYCGKPILSETDVEHARKSIQKHFNPSESDLVVIGTSHTNNYLSVGFAWQGIRQVIAKGHDGADLALLNALEGYQLDNFSEVTIMTGDSIFTDRVSEIASNGTIVTVISLARCLSNKLAAAASRIQFVHNDEASKHAA